MKLPIIIAASLVALVACAVQQQQAAYASGEIVDQAGHVSAGRLMAEDLLRYSDNHERVIAAIMDYAREREAIQAEGSGADHVCGQNCQRDLLWWRIGVDMAIQAKQEKAK